jgi:predicted transcriptional regulator
MRRDGVARIAKKPNSMTEIARQCVSIYVKNKHTRRRFDEVSDSDRRLPDALASRAKMAANRHPSKEITCFCVGRRLDGLSQLGRLLLSCAYLNFTKASLLAVARPREANGVVHDPPQAKHARHSLPSSVLF